MGRQDFDIVSRQGLAWLESAAWRQEAWLLHAFSTRQSPEGGGAGGLNLGFTAGTERAAVEANRQVFLRALGAESYALGSLRQVHSSTVYSVTRRASSELAYSPCGAPPAAAAPGTQPAGDALVTDEPGILLSIRVADCLPVLLADPRRRVVAAVHAGWRGALAHIVAKAAGEMRRLFGCEPRTCLAALGPSIRACCYEVGEEVVEAFTGRFERAGSFFRPGGRGEETLEDRYPLLFLSRQPPGHGAARRGVAFLDLVAVAREELLSAGFEPAHIQVADFCTACRPDLFFSYRKEGKAAGRQMAVIGIRPSPAREEGAGR